MPLDKATLITLKEKIREAGRDFLKKTFVSRKTTSTNRLILKNLRLLALVFLALGFLTGFTIMHLIPFRPAPKSAAAPGWFQKVFGDRSPLVGQIKNGDFLFSDFEEEGSEKAWTAVGSSLTRVEAYPSGGKYSLRITFDPKEKYSAAVLDNLLRNHKGGSNWYEYDALLFTLSSSLKEETKINLKITDMWGNQYQELLVFPGGGAMRFRIPVSKIEGAIEVGKIDAISFSAEGFRERRELYLDDVMLHRLSDAPTGQSGVSMVEVKRRNSERRPVNMLDYGFASRKTQWTAKDPQIGADIVRVPFMIRNETPVPCIHCAAEGSVPLPKGEVRELNHIRVRDRNNEDLPFQPKVLGRWPDGSVKWLNLVFDTTLRPGEGSGFYLDYGPRIETIDFNSSLRLEEDENEIRVNTGLIRVSLDKHKFDLFKAVYADLNADKNYGEDERLSGESTLRVSFGGREYRTDLARDPLDLRIEENGKKRIVIRAEGWFAAKDGKKFCRAIVRYYFYENQNTVQISYSLVYTGFPSNPYLSIYKEARLPANEPVDSFGFILPLVIQDPDKAVVKFGVEGAPPVSVQVKDSVRGLQTGWDKASVHLGGETLEQPAAFSGWAAAGDDKRETAVFVRRFRENFPKGIGFTKSTADLTVDLWPEEAGPLDLSTTRAAVGSETEAKGSAYGLAKTHEIFLRFGKAETEDPALLAARNNRLQIRVNPYWVNATGALGRLAASDRHYADQELMLEDLFDWAARMPRYFKWYGMLNFGDTLTWWRPEKNRDGKMEFGWYPEGRWGWYNLEGPGTHVGALLQFVRSGQWKYFEFGENLTRHLMDVDTVHYNTVSRDPRLKGVIPDDFSRAGSMHRGNGDHWGGSNEEPSHTNIEGLMLYYYLTGDERALEVAKESGEFFLSERFTYFGHPDIAPHSGMANALLGEVLLYEATGDDKYKAAADRLIEIFLRGQRDDGSFLEDYDPQSGKWSGNPNDMFMAWNDVSAFIAYHELTQDGEVKDMLLKLIGYLAPRDYAGPAVLHGIGYAYLITRDARLAELAQLNLRRLMQNRQQDRNIMSNGLVFEKAIYHRPNVFLATVPYAFGALDEYFDVPKKAQ